MSIYSYDRLLTQILNMCKTTGYIDGNPVYKKIANNIDISVEYIDDVNAYANGDNEHGYVIVMYAGLLKSFEFIGLALAVYMKNQDLIQLRDACNFLGKTAQSGFNQSNFDFGVKQLQYDKFDNEYIKVNTESFTTGCILAVIAHELGHNILGHTERSEIDYPISRNDERQADLVAQSIIAALPYQDKNIIASICVFTLFTWMSTEYDGPVATHPDSRERVYNAWRSNEEYFNSIHFDIESLEYFLPTGK